MANEIVPPVVPCEECMRLYTSGLDATDHVAIYCCHNFSFAIFTPEEGEWDISCPVLPEEASKIVFPGFKAPESRPTEMMRAAGRSLTEPPGLSHSALAYMEIPFKSDHKCRI